MSTTKTCPACGTTFSKAEKGYSQSVWERVRYCSHLCANRSTKPTDEERFLSSIKPSEESDCLLWTGLLDKKGYGRFWFDGAIIAAHRYAYFRKHGEIPEGIEICHRCDIPGCVNDEHLFPGTHADNMQDMCAKERNCFGERHVIAKLTDDAVREIRSSDQPISKLAEKFGVSISTASSARSGRTWRHVE